MTASIHRILITLAALVLGCSPAFAGTLTWDFTYGNGAGIVATGVLTTSDSLDALGGYDVLSISGTRNGDSITGLAGPAGTAMTLSSDGEVYFDNVLYASMPQADYWGLYFATASSGAFNVYSSGNAYFEFSDAAGLGTAPGVQVVFTATQVPEPAPLGLLGLGLGLVAIGVMKRRQAA